MADTSGGGSRRHRGGQPGNKNALKHGFYSPGFKPNETADLEEVAGDVDLRDEITMMRVIIRRVFTHAEDCGDDRESWAMVLGSLGSASTRLAGLLRTQKLLDGGGSDVADALSQALREVTSEISK